MRRVFIILLFLMLTGAIPPPKQMLPNVITLTTDDQCKMAPFAQLAQPISGNAHVYIIWYNNATHPWSGAQQTIFTNMYNNLFGSSWWSYSNEYNNLVTGISVTSTFTDPESEGTDFSGGGSTPGIAILQAAVNGGHLPNDVQGLYVIAPSWTDILMPPGITGENYYFTVTGGASLFGTMQIRGQEGNCPGPNGDAAFDGLMGVASHETGEGLFNGWGATANPTPSLCFVFHAQICDPCQFYPGTFAAGGGCANQTLGGTNYLLTELWIPSQGGYCGLGESSTSWYTTTCRTNSDCPAFSNHCVLGTPSHCFPPNCSDGLKNGLEVDVDCGTACTNTCASGKSCVFNQDCTSGICTAGICS